MRWIGLIAALLAISSGDAVAQTLLERAERDEIARVPKGDPDMAAAIRKARKTLPDFLALVRAPRPTITSFAVKIGIPEGDDAEFFWISPFRERDGRFIGRINNTPRTVKIVKLDQVIEFEEDDILDWLYHEDGRMYGNFTACALLKREPRNQAKAFMKKFGLSCDP